MGHLTEFEYLLISLLAIIALLILVIMLLIEFHFKSLYEKIEDYISLFKSSQLDIGMIEHLLIGLRLNQMPDDSESDHKKGEDTECK